MKQTEWTITIIGYESDDSKVKSEDKKVIEKYEAQKDPIEVISYITIAKLTGVQDEDICGIESEEEFTKLKYQFDSIEKENLANISKKQEENSWQSKKTSLNSGVKVCEIKSK